MGCNVDLDEAGELLTVKWNPGVELYRYGSGICLNAYQ